MTAAFCEADASSALSAPAQEASGPHMKRLNEGESSFTSGRVSKPHQQRYLSGKCSKSYQS